MGRPISKCQCREHCKARIVKGSGVYLAHTGQKSASQYGAPISFDIVCRQLRLGILIHGCHWHACPDHSKPSERAELKRTRDAMLADHARKEGWTVLTVWEHEINTDLTSVVARINNTFASLRTDMKDG